MVASNLPEAGTISTIGTISATARRAGRTGATSYTPSGEATKEAVHDAGLVRRFNAGEEHVFNEIMARHSTRIFGIANNLLHNAADAEEVTQDTFIRAHRAMRDFRGESSLATWLLRIAINLARNRYWYFFRRRRQNSISLETQAGAGGTATFSDLIAATSRTPVQETVTGEFTALIAGCMKRLDAPQREILTMRNTLGQPYDEIAGTLGISIGTVKSRISRARETLRKYLGECAPEFAQADEPSDYFEFSRPAPGCEAIAYA
jgi:RNA polymerase sigma-70 factor (ECF subfamily)